ncbi:PAS domain S-box protein, partial [candidate division KSB1 bacterium]|nr:PAS domain S-box protein [candidate division KSB1 bacterium]
MAQVTSAPIDDTDVQQNTVDMLQDNLYGALRESEAHFKELADTLPAYIWVSNEQGERIYCNRQWQVLTGRACEQLNRHWPEVIHTQDRERMRRFYASMLEQNKAMETEYQVIGQDMSVRWLLETVVPRTHKNGRLVGHMGCAIDFTRQKHIEQNLEQAVEARTVELQASAEKLEQEKQEQMALNRQLQDAQLQLVQAEKMASIGQLAAGVAHEINNPLGYINSNLHTLQEYLGDLEKVSDMARQLAAQLPSDHVQVQAYRQLKQDLDLDFIQEDLRSLVHESMEGATRAKQIVQDLRNFSRIEAQKREMFDIEEGLDATLNIVYNELKYRAKIHKEYAGLKPYECVGSQLNQVFMNLLVNAAHAIEAFGDITIRTGYQALDWLWVEVEDSGKGIPDEIKHKIFDPFFTTKPVGEGTGLGLSLTYKIVQDHNGKIEIDSTVGKGTRFRIYFPLNG